MKAHVIIINWPRNFEIFVRVLHSSRFLFSKCAVKDCCNTDIEIHHVKKLARRIDSSRKINVLTFKNKRLSGIGVTLSAVNRKQIPLCSFHHLEFEIGKQ